MPSSGKVQGEKGDARLIHIVGIVGLPGRYGGFETLVDNLLDSEELVSRGVVVYCEDQIAEETGLAYKGAVLRPLRWRANGWQSIIYDGWSMVLASIRGGQVLILGTAATLMLPALRLLFPRVRYHVNMAGLEWTRSKWGGVAKAVIRANEWAAAKYAHTLIADNEGLVEYVEQRYGINAAYIAYGGDQYLTEEENSEVFTEWRLPEGPFDFAIARAQSDNNLEMILDTYESLGEELVFVSNWHSSQFGRRLKERYAGRTNLHLVGPIYDGGKIKAIRNRARLYVHGHSAGGTNPALVEAMWAGMPTLAFDVTFNRFTTENQALYFAGRSELLGLLKGYDPDWAQTCGAAMYAVAQRKFRWAAVCRDYTGLLRGER